jgi:hypothetical protein
MQTKKNVLALMFLATLVGAVAFPTNSHVVGQTYDEKERVLTTISMNTKDNRDSLLTRWVSTEVSPPTIGDEEEGGGGLTADGPEAQEAGEDTQGEQSDGQNEYSSSFRDKDCTFTSTGRNPFFILEPNYQLVLSGGDTGEEAQVTITVSNETREVNGTETRVIEERETTGGELVEISRNFFAICEETNTVFYFGEEVDDYNNGNIIGHEGAWLAGEDANQRGIIMPGTILLGARYYQEIAPNIALDRAEIVDMGKLIQTPSGAFKNTLIIRETTPLEPEATELKYYAAGIGLIQEEDLKLERYGFIE